MTAATTLIIYTTCEYKHAQQRRGKSFCSVIGFASEEKLSSGMLICSSSYYIKLLFSSAAAHLITSPDNPHNAFKCSNGVGAGNATWRQWVGLHPFRCTMCLTVCVFPTGSDAVLRRHGRPLPPGWFVQRGEGQLREVQTLRHQTLSGARHRTRQGSYFTVNLAFFFLLCVSHYWCDSALRSGAGRLDSVWFHPSAGVRPGLAHHQTGAEEAHEEGFLQVCLSSDE